MELCLVPARWLCYNGEDDFFGVVLLEIRAKGKHDLQTVTELTRLSLFGKTDPKRKLIVYSGTMATLGIFLAAEMADAGATGSMIKILAAAALAILLELYLYFLAPKLRYRSLDKLQGIENSFVFGESSVRVLTCGDVYSGESETNYKAFVKAFETSRYLFLWQTKSSVFAVDKASVDESELQVLRERFRSLLGKKYVTCNY